MDIPNNLITGFFTVLGTFIGSWLTSGRARNERLWDLRREAYGVIASELGAIAQVLDTADAFIDHQDIHGYFDSSTKRRHEAAIHAHWEAARKRFAGDYLVLSDAFIGRFEKLAMAMDADEPNEDWDEERERVAQALRAAKVELTAIARRELTQRRGWFRKFPILINRAGK